MKTNLYFVKFPDGATYSASPQRDRGRYIPGGPVGFESAEMAQEAAAAINGYIVEQEYKNVVAFCLEKQYTLFIRRTNGHTAYEPVTLISAKAKPGLLLPVAQPDRQALIEVEERQRR